MDTLQGIEEMTEYFMAHGTEKSEPFFYSAKSSSPNFFIQRQMVTRERGMMFWIWAGVKPARSSENKSF